MIVKDLYHDCLLYEISQLAHCIHHLLTEKKISLNDDVSTVDFDQADHQKVAELVQNNVLGFRKIKNYSLKKNQKDFVFIFAASEQEAIHFYRETFHQHPLNCHENWLDFNFYRGNDVITFRDLIKEFNSFPAIAGYSFRY
ncbi:hypothetical protein [Neobacillus vireti]|uniref:hypothetical protein n=1 Tax=Neobacillus vireti TaxID=220686 RepID=UPI002FFFAB4F